MALPPVTFTSTSATTSRKALSPVAGAACGANSGRRGTEGRNTGRDVRLNVGVDVGGNIRVDIEHDIGLQVQVDTVSSGGRATAIAGGSPDRIAGDDGAAGGGPSDGNGALLVFLRSGWACPTPARRGRPTHPAQKATVPISPTMSTIVSNQPNRGRLSVAPHFSTPQRPERQTLRNGSWL